MSLLRFARPPPIRRPLTRHFASWVPRRPHTRYLACSVATVAVVSYLAYPPHQIHLDSLQYGEEETKCMSQVFLLFRSLKIMPHSGSRNQHCLPQNHADSFKCRESSTHPSGPWRAYCFISRYQGLFRRVLC